MIDEDSYLNLSGSTVVGQDGEKIGTVGDVFVDDQTGRAEWVTVNTGLFGLRETFVPLQNAQVQGDQLEVPYDKSTIKDAPHVDVDEGRLSEDEEAELFRHYGLQYSSAVSGTETISPAGFTESRTADFPESSGTGLPPRGTADPSTTGAAMPEPSREGTATGHDLALEATGSGYGDWGIGATDPGGADLGDRGPESRNLNPDTSGGAEESKDYAGAATGSGYGAWGAGGDPLQAGPIQSEDRPGVPDSATSGEQPDQRRWGRLRRHSSQA